MSKFAHQLANNEAYSLTDLIVRDNLSSNSSFISNETNKSSLARTNKQKLKQQFENSMQIYAYMAFRQRYHPIFLNRTLSYWPKSKSKSASTSQSSPKRKKFAQEASSQKITKRKPNLDEVVLLLNDQLKKQHQLVNSPSKSKQNNRNEITLNLDKFILNDKELIQSIGIDLSKAANLSSFVQVYGFQSPNDSAKLIATCPIKVLFKANVDSFLSLEPTEQSEVKLKLNQTSDTLNFICMRLVILLDNNRIKSIVQELPHPAVNCTSLKRKFNSTTSICSVAQSSAAKKHKLSNDETLLLLSKEEMSATSFKTFFLLISLSKTQNQSFENVRELNLKSSTAKFTFEMTQSMNSSFKLPKINFLQMAEYVSKFAFSLNRNCKEKSQEHVKSAPTVLTEYFNRRNFITFQLTVPNLIQEIQLNSKPSQINSVAQLKNPKNGSAKQSKSVIYNFNIAENHLVLDENDEIVKPKSNKTQINVKLAAQFNLKSLYTCPFCVRDCLNPICLNKHLINTHFRFQVYLEKNCKAQENGAHPSNGSKQNGLSNGSTNPKTVFELFKEDNYDGSYIGNQYDLHYAAHLGYSNCRVKPTKRASITYVLFNRKNTLIDLNHLHNLTSAELATLNYIQQQQFNNEMQPNPFFNCQTGMERLYYHTTTCLPMQISELDVDSDNELDPDWLKEQTKILINEFTDVNEGEKGLMKLWNLHCLHNNFIADSQVYKACESFIDEFGSKLIEFSLVNNFFLHLANLYDYGLLKPEQIANLGDYFVRTTQNTLKVNTNGFKFEPKVTNGDIKPYIPLKSFYVRLSK